MKTATFRLHLGAAAGVWFGAGVALGACGGDSEVAGEWIFEPEAEVPGWAINSGGDGDMGNLGLTGGAAFSTNVPPVNCDCGHSLGLAGTNGAAGAVSLGGYDPLAGAEKFTVMAWVRRESAAGENLSARIFSDADSTTLADTTAGVEFRFSGSAGNLALRINGTEVATTVGGVVPESGEWHHVAVVYDGTRAATNYTTRNVHFYVDGIQRGVGSVLQNAVVATNYAPVVVGNAAASRTAANLLAGNVDDVLVVPGWAPDAAGNGNANAAIQCFMETADDIFPPSIAAPPDVEAEADECLEPVAVALGSATAWDDCGVALVSNDAPAMFEAGLTEVTWTATDAAGNASTAVQSVAVVPSRTGDCDGDGLTDYEEEMELGTDATLWDTDGDGWGDGEEAAAGFDPLDAGDVPKVLLNAVLYNPSGTDTGFEWVELQSASVRDVDLGGFRLEVGRDGVWTLAAELAAETVLEPGQCLLIGESAVSNADMTAVLAIPNAWTNEPTTGVRLRRSGAAGRVADAVFIGGGAEFNAAGLDATGWADTNSVWAHAGSVLERRFPGVDNDRSCDWHEVAGHDGRNTSAVPDFDGDGLSDGDEWSGRLNPWGEPTRPWSADSDGDGLGDYAECVTHGTNPNAWASDGDIWPWMPGGTLASNWPGTDVYEMAHGWNPNVADENENGIPDAWEMVMGVGNLLNGADTDGDGIGDLDELNQNSNPLDNGDFSPRAHLVMYEPSKPGWMNAEEDNDIGLGGWVKVHYLGVKYPMESCVWVQEGMESEEFRLEWEGATEKRLTGGRRGAPGRASAIITEGSVLRIQDKCSHPEFTPECLGGEYAIREHSLLHEVTTDPTPLPQDRTDLGVCEAVYMDLEPVPDGTVEWNASCGYFQMDEGRHCYHACDTANEARISALYGGHTYEMNYAIIAPSGVRITKQFDWQSDRFTAGQAGAGMSVFVDILPTNVSFINVHFKEGTVEASDVTGYFVGRAETHRPAEDWAGVGWENALMRDDNCWCLDQPPPWSVGHFQWEIPLLYKDASGHYPTIHNYSTVTQYFDMEADGTIEIQKDQATTRRTP